jgi:hypothetical protein
MSGFRGEGGVGITDYELRITNYELQKQIQDTGFGVRGSGFRVQGSGQSGHSEGAGTTVEECATQRPKNPDASPLTSVTCIRSAHPLHRSGRNP